ncbi:conserved hypothetical protein [Ricinus communis]|uniref:DUF2827 domain-containing protein n=1 Tax=Ricinus communis TaxID=3988 RepID=B9TKX6_RICCO|nr:conserved hypothetical protein [Ricinus communis]
MAGGLDVEWIDHMRARGRKVVFHACGQPYVSLIEPPVFDRPGYSARAKRCDAIWILAKDQVFAPMLRTLHRCPVITVPYIWSEQFLVKRQTQIRSYGIDFGFQDIAKDDEIPRGLRVAIFEPNISVVKVCTVPMLICDAAFRQEAAAVREMHVLNSIHMRDHQTFSFLLASLQLKDQNRIRLEGRHDFVGYMGQFADAVVAHQWQNNQNYNYLDALWGNYPLIHNSEWLKDVGYYYHGSDIADGARQLIFAARTHDANQKEYRAKAQELFVQLSPVYRPNRDRYAVELLRLFNGAQQPIRETRSC